MIQSCITSVPTLVLATHLQWCSALEPRVGLPHRPMHHLPQLTHVQAGSQLPVRVSCTVLLQRAEVLQEALVHCVKVLQHGHAWQCVEGGGGRGGLQKGGKGADQLGSTLSLAYGMLRCCFTLCMFGKHVAQ